MRPRQTIDPAPVRLGPRATRIVQPSAEQQFAEPVPAPLPIRARVPAQVAHRFLGRRWRAAGRHGHGLPWARTHRHRAFRWTTGEARIDVPIDRETPPAVLDIDVAMTGPPKWLRVEADGCVLFDDTISGRWAESFRVGRLPADAAQPGDPAWRAIHLQVFGRLGDLPQQRDQIPLGLLDGGSRHRHRGPRRRRGLPLAQPLVVCPRNIWTFSVPRSMRAGMNHPAAPPCC